MTKKEERIYQFKITLQGSKPPIWRRIQVPEFYSFWDLHVAIQDAMGWMDCHLHQFEIIDPKYYEEVFIGIPDDTGWSDIKIRPGWKTKIAPYFSRIDHAFYLYDFGDNWEHKILLEKILPLSPGVKYPRCIAGKRACPPEDCGGIWGYEDLLEIMKNTNHKEYAERMEWLGGDFKPETFNPDAVKFFDPTKQLKIRVL